MIKYKLTTQENTTYNNTQWGKNVTHEASGVGELCTSGWLHFYHSPELAVLLNPIHADITNPRLWVCEAEGNFKDDKGLKGGCTKLTTLYEIPLPKFTLEQKVKFSILIVKNLNNNDQAWNTWADNWLSGKDRSGAAAEADAEAAAWAAWAAEVAARAARAAWAAGTAAWAAARAAEVAARAAWAAAEAAPNFAMIITEIQASPN